MAPEPIKNDNNTEGNVFQKPIFWIGLIVLLCIGTIAIGGALMTGMALSDGWRPVANLSAPATAPAPRADTHQGPATEVPTAATCTSPSIKVTYNGQTSEQGEYLNTELGERMTFTTRKVVIPGKAWNEPLSSDELAAVETSWVSVDLCVPEGMLMARIETGGLSQGTIHYEDGVTMTLQPGHYRFSLRNGAIAIWYPGQDSFAAADLVRIVKETLHGNLDIKQALAAHSITKDLKPIMDQYFTDLKVIDPIEPD